MLFHHDCCLFTIYVVFQYYCSLYLSLSVSLSLSLSLSHFFLVEKRCGFFFRVICPSWCVLHLYMSRIFLVYIADYGSLSLSIRVLFWACCRFLIMVFFIIINILLLFFQRLRFTLSFIRAGGFSFQVSSLFDLLSFTGDLLNSCRFQILLSFSQFLS